jgi:tetratricopeptide (TPR) repeat protein
MPSGQIDNAIGRIVGANLRAARLAKRYTQSKLAGPDFSVSYISAIERGQIFPSLRALEILAGRLGLTSTDLFPPSEQNGAQAPLTTSKSSLREQLVELELVEAQVAIRAGLYAQALEQLRELAEQNLSSRQHMRLKYLLGWAYAQALRLQESEDALLEAWQLARNTNNVLSAQILNVLGGIYASIRNYSQAIQTHSETLAQVESTQPQDPFLLAQVYSHMGQHYSYLDRWNDAIDMFRRALAISEELRTTQHLQEVYARLSQDYARTEEYHLAALNAYKLLEVSSQQSSLSLLGEIYHYLGRAMLKREKEEAYSYLQATLQEESVQQNTLALASLTTSMAEWFLANNDVGEAEKYAQQAYSLVRDTGSSLIAATTLLALGRIAYIQKDYATGDGHFEAGLQMLQAVGASEEFFDQAGAYARMLEDRGEFTKALYYFKQAYAIRQKIERNE